MFIVPSIYEKAKNGEKTYDIFSRLLKDRIIFIASEITNETSNIIISELLYLDSLSHDDISIYINSPGGSITAGMAIYDTMNFIKSDVSTICIGMAASMASIILASGKKGKRFILQNSEVMIHQPLGGVSGQTSDILIEAKEIEKSRKELYNIICHHTGQGFEKVSLDAERNYWMSSNEAKEYVMIDSVLKKH